MRLSLVRRRVLSEESRRYSSTLTPIPRETWPKARSGFPPVVEAFRSRDFLVQIFDEGNGARRMTVNRTEVQRWRDGQPIWRDGIEWDELQRLKAEAGYSDRWAVEIYPPDSEVINVANMRHLWLLEAAPAYAWQRSPA